MRNCSFNNQTLHSFEVQCTAGYDGGLPQVFVLELIGSRTGAVRFNMTNTEEPYFVIESLDALVQQQQQNQQQSSAASAASSSSASGGGMGLTSTADDERDDRKSAAAAISRTSSGTSTIIMAGSAGRMGESAGQPERAFKAVIFAVNQKGRSPRVILKEFVVGDADRADRSK